MGFKSDSDFVASLDKAQRDYYVSRLAGMQERLQEALRDLSRGLGTVGALNAEAMSVRLAVPDVATRVSR